MFGIGAGELMLLLVLALLVLGPERMPRLARDLGKTVGDLRRTSDELKQEFLNADAVIDRAAKLGEPDPPAAQPASPPSEEAGATQADVASPDPDPEAAASPEPEPEPEPEPDETAFDREARLARERLDDPARAARAKAEGWTVPTDVAGADSDKWS